MMLKDGVFLLFQWHNNEEIVSNPLSPHIKSVKIPQ